MSAKQDAAITISCYETYIDWAEWVPVNIDTSKIHGFQLDYRGGGEWFVIVHPKDGKPYEVKKGISRSSVHDLFRNPKAKILQVCNYHQSADFAAELGWVLKP
jgi:hypothetical protein